VVMGSRGVHHTPSHIFQKKGSAAHTAGWNGVKDFLELWPDVTFDYLKILVREKNTDEARKIESPTSSV
jgi:hypothetical protein